MINPKTIRVVFVALTLGLLIAGCGTQEEPPQQAINKGAPYHETPQEASAKTTSKASTESTTVRANTFKPVDTARPDFRVTLEDIRQTYVQQIMYTRPIDPQPLDLLKKGLERDLEATSDPKRKASILLALATISSCAPDGPSPNVQRTYLSDALTMSREANYTEAEAVAHGKLAMVEECEGSIEPAQKEIQRALELHKGLKMKCETAIDLCNWGMMLAKNRNFKEALPYLEEALELGRESRNDVAVAFSLCNLAACYAQTIDPLQRTDRVNPLKEELQHYRRLCVPFFLYYRRIDYGGTFMDAVAGAHVYNSLDLLHYRPVKNDPPIPIGYIEALYELPWP